MIEILIPIAILAGLGLLFGILLAVASKIFAVLEVVPEEQKDQLAGIIIGYSMANQMKEAKGG